jgi:hypothetical protein
MKLKFTVEVDFDQCEEAEASAVCPHCNKPISGQANNPARAIGIALAEFLNQHGVNGGGSKCVSKKKR